MILSDTDPGLRLVPVQGWSPEEVPLSASTHLHKKTTLLPPHGTGDHLTHDDRSDGVCPVWTRY